MYAQTEWLGGNALNCTMPLHQINVSPLEWDKGMDQDNPLVYQLGHQQQVRTVAGIQGSAPRCESQASSLSSNNCDICRICHCEGDSDVPLIAPCYCAGSLRYVHQACLQQWIKSSNIRCCELCKFQFIMQTKTKPFSEWEHLEMSGFERRKLVCAVMFHAVALTCVVWSLYVLIDRTVEEIRHGVLEWPFWTKLIVVAIGFTGGVVFMYIQCKAYLQICQRWKAFNRVIYVQNAPEKPTYLSPLTVSLPSHFTPDTQLKPFAPVRNQQEETSIDLKGVRNLHIFFNDENRVRVKKEGERASEEGGGEGSSGESCSTSHLRSDSEANNGGTSWHIKIGKSSDNSHAQSSSTHRYNDADNYGAMLGGPEVANEVPRGAKTNGDEFKMKCNDLAGNGMGESSVLKLQIKKAEIVIKFGGQKSNGGESSGGEEKVAGGTEGDRVNNDTVNIQIDSSEKDSNDPIVIDLVQNSHSQKSQMPEPPRKSSDPSDSASNPLQIRLDFGRTSADERDNFAVPTGSQESLPEAAANKLLSLEAATSEALETDNLVSRTNASWRPSSSEPGSGSQSPLLSTRDTKKTTE